MVAYFSNSRNSSPTRQFFRPRGSPRNRTPEWWWKVLTASGVIVCLVSALLCDSWGRFDTPTLLLTSSSSLSSSSSSLSSMSPLTTTAQNSIKAQKKTTIAIATSLTGCPQVERYRTLLLDTAAVLRHSIDQTARTSKYAYDCIAFVHPDAVNCTTQLEMAGFQVQIRDTPIDVSQIQNTAYRDRMIKSGCCGATGKNSPVLDKELRRRTTSYSCVAHLPLLCGQTTYKKNSSSSMPIHWRIIPS